MANICIIHYESCILKQCYVCHLPKRSTSGFGMVFGSVGQRFETVKLFWIKIKRFGVQWIKFWSASKVKCDPSVLLVSLLKLPGIIADKCVSMHDGQWKAALNASWSFIKQNRLVYIHPWKDLQHLCVGLVVDCTLFRQALIIPVSKLFR